MTICLRIMSAKHSMALLGSCLRTRTKQRATPSQQRVEGSCEVLARLPKLPAHGRGAAQACRWQAPPVPCRTPPAPT